jgi:hypothetical protein
MKGLTTDREDIEKIMALGEYLTLSVCDEKGIYNVPVNYGFRDNCLYIHSGKSGRKYQALLAGNEICFSVVAGCSLRTGENPCKWGYLFKSVVGFGEPRLIENDEEKIKAFSIIMDQYGNGTWEFEPASLKGTAVFEIPVTRISARIKE